MGRQCQILSRVSTSLALFVIISITLPTVKAENVTYPTANQNLSPAEVWRSTEFCLQNTSSSCKDKFNYTLTDSGWLNVTKDDGPKFCEKDGCADHTRAVLLCLYEVKKDYWFVNHATIKDLNDTINSGCNAKQARTMKIKSFCSHPYQQKLTNCTYKILANPPTTDDQTAAPTTTSIIKTQINPPQFGPPKPGGFTGVSKYSSHGFRPNSAPIFTAVSAAAFLYITLS